MTRPTEGGWFGLLHGSWATASLGALRRASLVHRAAGLLGLFHSRHQVVVARPPQAAGAVPDFQLLGGQDEHLRVLDNEWRISTSRGQGEGRQLE